MSNARTIHTATLFHGKVLVAGGIAGGSPGSPANGVMLASAELFDPASETWSSVASLITGRVQHTATLLPNGTVLVTGGEVSTLQAGQVTVVPTQSTEMYW
jgi:hypothetical protein